MTITAIASSNGVTLSATATEYFVTDRLGHHTFFADALDAWVCFASACQPVLSLN